MAKKKVNDTKANIENGMYFKFKENKYRSYTNKVYKVEINDKGYMTLQQYHCHSKTGKYMWIDLVVVRRIGENSLDYYKHDMFGKKTRGRIHYSDIDCFISVVKDKQGKDHTKITKAA